MPLNPKDFPDLEASIYGRNSQDKNKGLSVPQQVRWGCDECARFGWSVAHKITDTDIGATRHTVKQRPGYQQLVAALREPSASGRQRVLVTRSSSRANRQLLDFAILREMCARLGVFWYSGGQLYDLNNPTDRRILAQEAVDNEYGPEQNRFDSMQQLHQNFLDGKPHSREAFGYMIVYKRGRSVGRVPDPDKAPIVAEMARRALSAVSTNGIARWLTSDKVLIPSVDLALPCRKCSVTEGRKVLKSVDRRTCPCDKSWRTRWDHVMVRKVLTNPTIAGLRAHKNRETGEVETVPATWKAIVPLDDFMQLAELFAQPSRMVAGQQGSAPKWLLSGIPTCGACGGVVRSRSGGRKRARMYECENFCVSRLADPIDDLVEEAVLQRLEDPDLLVALARTDAQAEAAQAEAKRLRGEYDKWVREAIAAELAPAEIRQYKDRKLPSIKAAEARAQAALPMPHVVEAAGPQARAKWHDPMITPLEAKRNIIRSLLSITIQPAGKRQGYGAPASLDKVQVQRLVA
ncbi:recombinase family protein [Nocardia sp. CDC160]|uniref:recombinase family protein n=1 Tax=Nocardia sp. CDC160 TaxID=3112166 RepID=UPI002DB86C1A|nr:recombinase family protein [Nocardia sp. CDC160]MEC3915491.1 recombinase family protein [Nocardia sp. CDC160]